MILRHADRLAVVYDGETVYVAAVPRGAPVALSGSAGAIWAALPGTPQDVASRVSATYAVAADDVHDVVEEFLRQLLDRGLVVASPDVPGS